MNVWAVFPSPSASPAALKVIEEWRAAGFKVALLTDDVSDVGKVDVDAHIGNPVYRGWGDAMNQLCQHVVKRFDADLVVCVGDDLFPRDGLTADRLAESFRSRFGDSTFGVLQCTGDQYGEIEHAAVSPALGRDFITGTYGGNGPMFDGYRHLYVDRELQDLATSLGCFAQDKSLNIYHDHWSRGLTPDRLPAENRKTIQNAAECDRLLYEQRRAAGFPGSK